MRLLIISIIFISLVACSADQAQQTFIFKDATAIGIDFRNDLEDNDEENALVYDNFYSGGGVAVIDFNNDGYQDLMFSGNQSEDALYLNNGDWTFQNLTSQAGILKEEGWSTGVSVVDINNDGWEDLYICRSLRDDPLSRKNRLYINQQNNTFIEQADKYGLADVWRTQEACFFDYDQDGDQDVLMINQPPNPGPLSAIKGTDFRVPELGVRFYQNDNSKFVDRTDQVKLNHKGYPLSASISDFNKDGWLDIFIAHDYNSPDKLYLNQGGKHFLNTIDTSCQQISFFSMGTDAGDLNNDNIDDIVSLDMVASDPYRNKANMGGMNPKAFWKVVDDGGHYQYMYNAVHISQEIENNIPYYTNASQMFGMSNTDWSWSPLIGDFDNDGYNDVFISNGIKRDIRFSDAINIILDSINHTKKTLGIDQSQIRNNLNYKTLLDKFPSSKLSNYLFKNNKGESFKDATKSYNLDQPSFSNGAAYVDLDNDGDLDLVINNIDNAPSIYENDISNNNYLKVYAYHSETNKNSTGIKVKVFGPGYDIEKTIKSNRGFYSSSEQLAHFGLGDRSKVDSIIIEWNRSEYSVHYGVNANSSITLVKPKNISGSKKDNLENQANYALPLGIDYVHQENLYDDYQHQVLLPYQIGINNCPLDVGDYNGDGKEDIFIGETINQSAFVNLNNGDAFNSLKIRGTQKECTDLASADFDGDGDLDILASFGGNEFPEGSNRYANEIYTNDGKGGFTKNKIQESEYQSDSKICILDFDGDDKMDFVVTGRHIPHTYPSPASTRIFKNVSKSNQIIFQDVTKDVAPFLNEIGMVTNVKAGDLDGDGDEDLVLVGEWMSIKLLYNEDSKFILKSINKSIGWWRGLLLKDVNEDGLVDIVAGNIGSNSKYKVNEKLGFSIYYKDLDENGKSDIILAYEKNNHEFPIRGRSCSSEQIPEIANKYPTYHEFAIADLQSIYSENLDNCDKVKAEEFSSGVYIQTKDGTFSFNPFPKFAQTSIINDFVETDSGKLICSGNLLYFEIETPKLDGCYGYLLDFSDFPDIQGNDFVSSKMGAQITELLTFEHQGKRSIVFIPLNGPIQFLSFPDM